MSSLTPSERRLRASAAGNAAVANQGGKQNVAPAREGFEGKFRAEIRTKFPDLSNDDVEERAAALMRSHMKLLALKSSKARRERREAEAVEAAERAVRAAEPTVGTSDAGGPSVAPGASPEARTASDEATP